MTALPDWMLKRPPWMLKRPVPFGITLDLDKLTPARAVTPPRAE
nr:hypothetical protein StreXyl84_23200 [Streptomyces sp. Xyl84]